MGEAGRDGGMAFSRHSGARVARTSDVQLHIGESRDSGSTRRRVSRNVAGHRAHGCKEHFRSRPGQKTPISLQIMRVVPTSLDIWGPADITAQPLGSSSRNMRHKITKLI